jgi:hypothetical protein
MKRFKQMVIALILISSISACATVTPPMVAHGAELEESTPSTAPAVIFTPTAITLKTPVATMPTARQVDPMNITIEIDGQPVTLVNGLSEVEAAPGSSTKVTTRFFGNQVSGKLPRDLKTGTVFLVTQDPGGSGTFFYVVAAVQNDSGGYTGTNAILLGDRIAPQNINLQGDRIVVNYADRKPDEPMTTSPSVGVSKYLQLQQGRLVEVTAN